MGSELTGLQTWSLRPTRQLYYQQWVLSSLVCKSGPWCPRGRALQVMSWKACLPYLRHPQGISSKSLNTRQSPETLWSREPLMCLLTGFSHVTPWWQARELKGPGAKLLPTPIVSLDNQRNEWTACFCGNFTQLSNIPSESADDTTLMAESEEELKSLLLKSERGEWKSWLNPQHSENKDHGIWPHHFMANRWGNNGNSERLHFLGL